jgi:hypothetical protein
MSTQLPPGPRTPALIQTIGTWLRPTGSLQRLRRRHGGRFTVRYLRQRPFVVISDPEEIKQIFQAPADVLHPGEGARILEPIVGRHSLILLDQAPHMEQRRLLLPAFHGERMARLTELMGELTAEEIERWPLDQPVALHGRLQGLTLEIILRAVFGLQRGARLDALRDLLTQILAFGDSPLSLLGTLPSVLTRVGPGARAQRLGARVDELLFELIDQRRAEPQDGQDILSMLLSARHEDDSPMSPQEIRDELMTALVAGHETTASELAWGFERLAREPRVTALLTAELDRGQDDAYLNATINEILRIRPVLPNAEPRLVMKPVQIGGVSYPPGIALLASAWLLHHDPAVYPEPERFLPERFLESAPGTYTWIPFGGGRRRCIGASFALLEMRIVIRAVLQRFTLAPASARRERTRRRSITLSPASGATVVLGAREPAPEPVRAERRDVPAPA